MKYQLIGYGDDLPDWAVSTQAQLAALRAGPRGRWRRFRRCDVICERCREQLGEVMETAPPVVVTRRGVHSAEHPHTRTAARELDRKLRDGAETIAPPDEQEGDEDYFTALSAEEASARVDADLLAARLARVSSTHSWWLPLDMLPDDDDPMRVSFELRCKCRSVAILRDAFLGMIDGRTHVIM